MSARPPQKPVRGRDDEGTPVRRVRSEGPQRVTVHGKDEVVVISAEEFRRLKGGQTGAELIAAMQASPYREIDMTTERTAMPVRGVPFP
jgi:PHD/YefM family antitoxin component YafN of YafNO toxin-antitoxin module